MKRQVNLLVIEDNPADADLIQEYLSSVVEFNSNLFCVRTLEEAKKFLHNNHVHVVLLDLSLPDSRGVETVREVIGSLESATAIVLTSLDDKKVALAAIECGAQDYLLKGAIDSEVLSRVIRFSLQRIKWHNKMNEIQSQLYQAQKMDSIGRLAGGVAHDFNNQLGIIKIICSIIKSNLDADHPVINYITQIETVTDRSTSLTKRLLAFSRIQPLELATISLNDLINENKKLVGHLLGEDITIRMDLDDDAYINVDPGLMAQALMNLAINAKDAMPDGGQLEFTTKILHNNQVLLNVTDNGIGMSEEVVSKIFEPFYTTKEVGKGTGLGLSMVMGIVQQSGGDIKVKSALGKGTTFSITFPTVEAVKEDSQKPLEDKDTSGNRETILLVDDEPSLREVMQEFLTLHQYEVLVAADGVEALKIIQDKTKKIGLLITDVRMPKMGGAELVEKARVYQPDIKVLFTSGYIHETTDERIDLKKVSFLPKPASSKDLLKKVKDSLAS